MAWYTCEISLSVTFPVGALGGYHHEARDPAYQRGLQRTWRDRLFGQLRGSDEEKARRLRRIQDFLRSDRCVFVLSSHPADADAFPSIDTLRARLVEAVDTYNTLNEELSFEPAALEDPQCVRWLYHNGVTELEYVYTLHPRPADLPEGTRPAQYQMCLRVRDPG